MSQLEYRQNQDVELPTGSAAAVWGMAAGFARRFSIWFWLMVLIPALLGGVYIFFIASDAYMSEARFIVRSQDRQQPGMVASLLRSPGMQHGNDGTSAVESFITSRDAVREMESNNGLRDIFGRPEGDFVTRFPNPISGTSFEALYKHYLRFVDVIADPQTGVVTLQVKAYRPQDAQTVARALLLNSEKLINQMNKTAEDDAVAQGLRRVKEAEGQLATIQKKLMQYRVRAQILDPALSSTTAYQSLGGIMAARIATATQIAEMTRQAPGNPALANLKSRLSALNAQLAEARNDATGGGDSLASKLGDYTQLSLASDLASKTLDSATQAMETARTEAQRKHLYVEHIAEPNLPDYPLFPRRLLFFACLVTVCLLVYGIAWLLIAGVREHAAD